MLPNKLDHYLQSQRVPFERYTNDTFFLAKSKSEAKRNCLEYEKIATELKTAINKKKTKIIPLSNNFIYCKWKYTITENGKIIRIPVKKTIYIQRRKLKRMIKLFYQNQIDEKEILVTKKYFNCYLKIGNTYFVRKSYDKYF